MPSLIQDRRAELKLLGLYLLGNLQNKYLPKFYKFETKRLSPLLVNSHSHDLNWLPPFTYTHKPQNQSWLPMLQFIAEMLDKWRPHQLLMDKQTYQRIG